MKELILPPADITKQAAEYGEELVHFIDRERFPPGLLSEPDYVAFKAASPTDFANKARAIKLWSEQVAFAEIDWRFFVAAQMIIPLPLTSYRHVGWLEIIEPKNPDTRPATADYQGLEYSQFYFDDLNKADKLISSSGINVQRKEDKQHRWLNVCMNSRNQEIRISDTKLVEIVSTELEDGTARLL